MTVFLKFTRPDGSQFLVNLDQIITVDPIYGATSEGSARIFLKERGAVSCAEGYDEVISKLAKNSKVA